MLLIFNWMVRMPLIFKWMVRMQLMFNWMIHLAPGKAEQGWGQSGTGNTICYADAELPQTSPLPVFI